MSDDKMSERIELLEKKVDILIKLSDAQQEEIEALNRMVKNLSKIVDLLNVKIDRVKGE